MIRHELVGKGSREEAVHRALARREEVVEGKLIEHDPILMTRVMEQKADYAD